MDGLCERRSAQGKLKRAAAHWARRRTGTADHSKPAALTKETRSDFEKLGVKREALPQAKPQEHFGVWEANWPALLLFLDLQTQWVIVPGENGFAYVGLNYQAVESFMNIAETENRKAMMKDLQVMEGVAAVILNGGDWTDEDPA